MQSPSKRRLVLVASIIFLIIIGLVYLLARPQKQSTTQQVNEYVDPFSHETISSPPGKSPDTYGESDKTLFLGFDKLLDLGLTSGQLDNVENALLNYSKSTNQSFSRISVDVDNITSQYDNTKSNSPFIIQFRVQFNGKKIYNAKVQYLGLRDVRIYLTEPESGKLVYDSQVLYTTRYAE